MRLANAEHHLGPGEGIRADLRQFGLERGGAPGRLLLWCGWHLCLLSRCRVCRGDRCRGRTRHRGLSRVLRLPVCHHGLTGMSEYARTLSVVVVVKSTTTQPCAVDVSAVVLIAPEYVTFAGAAWL